MTLIEVVAYTIIKYDISLYCLFKTEIETKRKAGVSRKEYGKIHEKVLKLRTTEISL